MSTWEERMAERAHTRATEVTRARDQERLGEFTRWSLPDDPEEILLEVIAARCLGIGYGDPGPKIPADERGCPACWGSRFVWMGNCWGLHHVGGPVLDCTHSCHADEVLLAGHRLTFR